MVDDSLAIVVISEGDFIENCTVLLLVIHDLDTWLVAEDNLVDNSLVIVVISECDFMHNCSVLLFVIEDLETWSVVEDNCWTKKLIQLNSLISYLSFYWYGL